MSNVTTLSTRELVSPAEIRDALDVDVRRVLSQTAAIQQVMRTVMIKDVHYGVIPGTDKDKPTLYQAGADKICMLFRLRPRYRTTITTERDFISVQSTCRLIHIPTREEWGEGQGWANSREDKYVNQATIRLCPKCDKPTIFRSKKEERDGSKGWYCWEKKGGCGMQFSASDPAIESQGTQVVGDKVWNLANTILKIANKRAKAAAVLTATAASDIFTQDLDDLEEVSNALDVDAREKKTPATNGAANGVTGNGGQPSAANGNVAPANGSPPPATNGNGNGNGAKRGGAGPLQIRDLTTALRGKLQATEPDRQMAWVNGMLPKGRVVSAFTELTPDEAATLAKAAENGEVPGGAEK
jgi:hypothetical protein